MASARVDRAEFPMQVNSTPVGTGHSVSPLQQGRPVQPGGHSQLAVSGRFVSAGWRFDFSIPAVSGLAAAEVLVGSGCMDFLNRGRRDPQRILLLPVLGTNESTREFAVDLGSDRSGIEPGADEELASFLAPVDARRLDVDGRETSAEEFIPVLVFFKRAGDAANPQLHAFADFRGNIAAHNEVRDGQSSARLQNTESFPQYAV